MKPIYSKIFHEILLPTLMISLIGCGGVGTGGGKAGNGGGGEANSGTIISGKVSLSSTVTSSSKPINNFTIMETAGKPDVYLKDTLMAASTGTGLSNADVYLYNAEHPEWLYPVAEVKSDRYGNYTLDKLTNGSLNKGAYNDGDAIPNGKYTLLSYKAAGFDPVLGMTVPNLVAVQAVVKEFNLANETGVDLMVQPSDAVPFVISMFGASRNTDGTQTWGGTLTTLPTNAAIQITFSMPMSRGSLNNGIATSPSLAGNWALSSDWLTATFYLAEGTTLMPNKTYTVTVKGADQYQDSAVVNVYSNALAKTATGRFVTESGPNDNSPLVTVVSPSTTTGVDIVTPVQISSDIMLDINTIDLVGLGPKPGVLYLGKGLDGKYVYEFISEALLLNKSYSFTISGKGINGISMSPVSFSFTTSATSTGIDSTAGVATMDEQARVKDVFAKWVRALSYRNISYLQSRMAGDFYFEYNTLISRDQGGQSTDPNDINRDGRYSISEFSGMMVNQIFPQWEGCKTKVDGNIVGSINLAGDTANFEFKLSAPSTDTSDPSCLQSVPTGSLYATVQNINGAWTIVRASEGLDTRNKPVGFPKAATTQLYEVKYGGLLQSASPVPDGGQLSALPNDYTESYKFTWDPIDGATSVVLMAVDSRDRSKGFAYVFPASVTSYSTNKTPQQAGGYDVGGKFGLSSPGIDPKFQYTEGGEYYWEVMGFGTTGVNTFSEKQQMELIKDIIAISDMKRFSIAGIYKELTVIVKSGSAQLSYNDLTGGFDAGAADAVNLTIITPNTTTAGNITVSEQSYWGQAYINNVPFDFTSEGIGTYTVNLHRGLNYVHVDDGAGLFYNFTIKTTGGTAPVISITSITDENSNHVAGDTGYYSSLTASMVNITGSVSDLNVAQVTIYMWNSLGVNTQKTVDVTGGSFTASFDIYGGDNVFQFSASGTSYYYSYIDVHTSGGTRWTLPIQITGVDTASQINIYGSGSDWDASADSDNRVTITGVLANKRDGTYSLWNNGTYDTGSIDADDTTGAFSLSLDAELSHGWNYVSINDSDYHWYNLSIYTENGKVVIKPTVTKVDGTSNLITTWGAAATDKCLVTVEGTAQTGPVNVYWNAYDGSSFYNESQSIYASGTDGGTGSFSTTVPVVGGADSYNYIYVYDKNYKSVGFSIITTDNCTYTAPAMTIAGVKDSGGTTLTPTSGIYNSSASPSVTVTGTLNRPNTPVMSMAGVCSTETYFATSGSTPNVSGTYDWTISGIKVYQYPTNNNWISFNGPGTYNSIQVNSANSVRSYSQLRAEVAGAIENISNLSCSSSTWPLTSESSVTITGTTTEVNSLVKYTDPVGTQGTVTTDASGNFSIGPITVYNGSNNINIFDSKWNSTTVIVNTSNGVSKPKFVAITDPLNNAYISGVYTVRGTVSDPVGQGYNPGTIWVYAAVGARPYVGATYCDYYYTSYTNDTNALQWGYQPLTYSNGAFSFDLDFKDGICPGSISVYGVDGSLTHSHSIFVNSVGGTESWSKPGTAPVEDGRIRALRVGIMKWIDSVKALTTFKRR